MAAHLRFVAHAAERHAREAPAQRLRDALAERRLADARRPDEAHDAAARRPVERAHGEILEDPLFDGLEIVVIAIEDVARGLQIEPVFRGAVPRQGREHFEVGTRHVVLGRLGRHLPQPLELALDHLGGFLVQAGAVEPVGQLRQLVVRVLFTQLLADDAQLLAQHVFALVLVQPRPHLLLDLAADLEHLQLLAEQFRQALQPVIHVVDGEQLGLGREGEVQVGGYEVGELARVGNADEHLVQLLAQVGRDVDDAGELGMHGALQRLGARILRLDAGERLIGRDQPVLGGRDLLEAGALQALHHDAHRTVAQLEHAHDRAERADLVQLVRTGMHDGPLGGLGPAERFHDPQQQPFVTLHHLVDELYGVRVGERHRQHDVRIDDQPPQRQDGKTIHLLHPNRLRP